MNVFEAVPSDPIEYVRMPEADEFAERFVATRTPVVVDDVASRMPCVRPWNYDYFAQRIPTIKVQRPENDGTYHYLRFERMSFDDFAANLHGERNAYAIEPLVGKGAPPENAERFDHGLPGFVAPERFRVSNLYLGPGGNKSLLHYDETHSFLYMVEGRKRFMLFRPDQTRYLYPYGVFDIRSILQGRVIDSRVNADALDDARFPRVRQARGIRGEMGPGQALYIPAGTWHFIEAERLNISVNYFWLDSPVAHWLRRPLLDFWFKRRIIDGIDIARAVKRRLTPKPAHSAT